MGSSRSSRRLCDRLNYAGWSGRSLDRTWDCRINRKAEVTCGLGSSPCVSVESAGCRRMMSDEARRGI